MALACLRCQGAGRSLAVKGRGTAGLNNQGLAVPVASGRPL